MSNPTPKQIQDELAGHFDPDAFMQPEIAICDWHVADKEDRYQAAYDTSMFSLADVETMHPDAENIWFMGNGIGVRMSAPGYLDNTSWVVWDAIEWQEALAHLIEHYGTGEPPEAPTIRSVIESHCALALDDETDRERLIEALEIWHKQHGVN